MTSELAKTELPSRKKVEVCSNCKDNKIEIWCRNFSKTRRKRPGDHDREETFKGVTEPPGSEDSSTPYASAISRKRRRLNLQNDVQQIDQHEMLQKIKSNNGWEIFNDEKGRTFRFNFLTLKSSWNVPSFKYKSFDFNNLRVLSSPAVPRIFIHDQLFLCGVEQTS